MAVERTDKITRLMEKYGLPWADANEDLCDDAASKLRAFKKDLPEDRRDAARAIERLNDRERGEATEALRDHWDGFAKEFDAVASAAGEIADGLAASLDAIADTKRAIIDVVINFQERIDDLTEGAPHWIGRTAEQEEAVAADASATRTRLEPEISTARNRCEERLTRVRNDTDVAALKRIAGLPEGTGNGDSGRAVGSLAPGVGSGSGGSTGGSRAFGGDTMATSPGTNAFNGFWTEHDEHKRAISTLDKVATHLRDETSTALAKAAVDIAEFGASGALGASVAAGYAQLLDDLVLATRALGNHLTGPLSDAIRAASEDQKRIDDDTARRFWWKR
ncbi:hypothetical protein DEJ45_15900 [Streptomyces venezuelae]|uniref:hypothetical protein n=1 Tax=Streptomyces venezuelae TaxID=54571 RepID=UPI00123D4E9D|nr:hypothetical protein [Streptomyces venezuelae]QES13751.1 hypothetical protein DEJ45_15900 [Streptomyces venezuelae]